MSDSEADDSSADSAEAGSRRLVGVSVTDARSLPSTLAVRTDVHVRVSSEHSRCSISSAISKSKQNQKRFGKVGARPHQQHTVLCERMRAKRIEKTNMRMVSSISQAGICPSHGDVETHATKQETDDRNR